MYLFILCEWQCLFFFFPTRPVKIVRRFWFKKKKIRRIQGYEYCNDRLRMQTRKYDEILQVLK